MYTVEPLIKDTTNKGHNRNNLRTKDNFQCPKWRLSYGSNNDKGQPLRQPKDNLSDKGQPLNERTKMAMGPKHVRYSEVPLYIRMECIIK